MKFSKYQKFLLKINCIFIVQLETMNFFAMLYNTTMKIFCIGENF